MEKDMGDPKRHVDAWIIYDSPSRGKDPRMPGRKVAFSSLNRETLIACLPARKTKMRAQPRDSFMSCGEKTNHELTYSGVSIRSMSQLPRLSWEDRCEITGVRELPSEDVCETTEQKGFPLFWSDWKSIALFAAIFKNFSATHVFDLTPGSVAAAVGAYHAGIKYEAACINEAHKNWLDHVMDGVTFGVLAEGSVQADSQMVEKIKYYFTSTVKEAQRVLHADVPDEEDEDNKEEDVDDSDSDEDSKA